MNRLIENKLYIFLVIVVLSACYPEQEVAPVVPPTDNPVATVTARASNKTAVSEGDTLWFDVELSAMVNQDIDFAPVMSESSTSDLSDLMIVNGTMPAFALTQSVGVVIIDDEMPEAAETLSFDFDASGDPGYNFQLNMETSNTVSASVPVADHNYSLDWGSTVYADSAGVEHDLCHYAFDLDTYIANGDFSVADWGAATGDCPEYSSFGSLPAGDYDIYVDFYAFGATDEIAPPADWEFPYVLTLGSLGAEVYSHTGSFTMADEGASTVVGTMTIAADGTYTVTFN